MAVNTQVAVYDRTGCRRSSRRSSWTRSIRTRRDASSFDPKVVYDQYDDTFVVVYLVQEDSPRRSLHRRRRDTRRHREQHGHWCPTSFPGDALPGGSPQLWADYPGLGYNDTRVTITTNQFTFPSRAARFRYSQIMTIEKTRSVRLHAAGPDADRLRRHEDA